MKYFTSELWNAINSEIATERKRGKLEWLLNSEKYNKYFSKKIKNKLKPSFIKTYNDENRFHDFIISNIQITNLNNKKCNIKITIEKSGIYHSINYYNITAFNYNMINEVNFKYSCLHWGYDEFELLENMNLRHSILFDNFDKLQIEFKKIILK